MIGELISVQSTISFILGALTALILVYVKSVVPKDYREDKKWVKKVSNEIEALNSTLSDVSNENTSVVKIEKDITAHIEKINELIKSSTRFRSELEKNLREINENLEIMQKPEKSILELSEGEYETFLKENNKHMIMEEEPEEVRRHFKENMPKQLVKQANKDSKVGFFRNRARRLL